MAFHTREVVVKVVWLVGWAVERFTDLCLWCDGRARLRVQAHRVTALAIVLS
mgnify:CR=1 FL=1